MMKRAMWLAAVTLVGCGQIVPPPPTTDLPPLTVAPGAPVTTTVRHSTSTSISEPAMVTARAVRVMDAVQETETLPPPPETLPPTADGPSWAHCPQWWSEARDVGWPESQLVHMDRIMYRESRCQPGVFNRAGANGLMQVMSMWADDCGGTIAMLRTATFNLACALHVLEVQGWGAWSTN